MSEFEVGVDWVSVQIIYKFVNCFLEYVNESEKELLQSYFFFTTSLNFRITMEMPANNNQPERNVSTSVSPSDNSEFSKTNEIRYHSVKNIIGCFYPSTTQLKKFEIPKSIFHFTRDQLLRVILFPTQFEYELIDNSENAIVEQLQINIIEPVSQFIGYIYNEQVTSHTNHVLGVSYESRRVFVTPDITVSFPKFNLPIEIKKKNVADYFKDFNENQINHSNSDLIEIFTHFIREMLMAGSPIAILSNSSATLIIDIQNYKVSDFIGLNYCKILRRINCNIFYLDDYDAPSSDST
ncbi:uncharacterized protein RJT21DRAFT_40177 [Scheffersomyces amazonensis]|uniref:uncharacterized protein n=1 Tax=Scheffersomyces amazonensis TaxID=1078765 RepID=UPI00315DD512